MTDISNELESLEYYVHDASDFSKVWLQHIPDKYTPNELSIRYTGDTSQDETGYHYRLDREYQFVYFGESEFDCIQKASAIQKVVKNDKAIQIKDSDKYLRFGSFSFSQPVKAEDSNVHFVIGILQAQVRQARTFTEYEKMKDINVNYDD